MIYDLFCNFAPMKQCCLIILMICSLTVSAQQERTWEEVWQEMMTPEDMDETEETWEDYYERLQQLADHPIDLNHTNREDLEQLPFLSAQQVMDIMEYLDRYGPMRSLNELKMIRSLDYQQIALLPFFVYVGEVVREEPQ